MALYCTPAAVVAVAGQLAVDLRTDDVPDLDTHLGAACAWSTSRIEYYCSRYSTDVLAGNAWVQGVAEFLAVYWLCLHRLNDVPKSIEAVWKDEYKPELEDIRKGLASVPRAASSRRPVAVTNYTTDLNRRNNTVRVDKSRSTGVSPSGYVQPRADAPDQR